MMKSGPVALIGVLIAGTGVFAQRPSRTPPPGAPPASLTVPNPFAPASGAPDLYQLPDGSDRFRRHSWYRPYQPPPLVLQPGIYVPGLYDYADPHDEPFRRLERTFRRSMPPVEPPRGGLTLETVPGAAQVFVDGFYVGVAEEFGPQGRTLDMAAGAHHVELRRPGYEPLSFSVMIEPHQTVRYRGDMRRVSTPLPGAGAMPPPQQTAAKSVYVIPNCYAGDRPPAHALPKGCDRKNLQTRK